MYPSVFRWAATLAMASSLALSPAVAAAGTSSTAYGFSLQKRVETKPGSGEYRIVTTPENWDPAKTAIIVCDMWDLHHRKNAVKRECEFAPRMNELPEKAPAQGAFIVRRATA